MALSPLEIYKKFLLKVNKNDTNGNVKVPKSQFVLIFNEQKRKFLEEFLKKEESSDYIEDFEELLVPDEVLEKISDYTLKTDFKLPSDFLKRTSSYAVASKGDCKNRVLYTWPTKPKDINVLLQNSNQNPSFEYQETLVVLNSGKASVYKTDFTIDEFYLTYYREPKDLDIEGYTHIDGTPSTNIDIGLSDILTELIIDRAVTETLRNYESTEQLQIALQREQSNEK
jgi:hypothetical protein